MTRLIRRAAMFAAITILAVSCSGGDAEPADDAPETSEASESGDDATSEPDAGSEAEAPERASITVATLSPSHVTWAHTFVAQALGYFDEEALDVEVLTNLPGGTVSDALVTGQIDFGGVSQAQMLAAVAQDPSIQWFLVDNNYPFMIMTAADSEISTVEDLVGATIGMPETNDEVTVDFLMAAGGVAADQYETVPTGGRAAMGVALIDGRVDAVMGTAVDRSAIEGEAGLEVKTIETGQSSEFLNGGYAASVQLMEEQPDLVVRFGRAIAKGAIWMHENPEATIDILAELVPEAVPDREAAIGLREFWNNNDASRYEARFDTDLAIWQDMIDAYVGIGAIDESYDAELVFTNRFLEDIWDFDVDAIVDDARNDRR